MKIFKYPVLVADEFSLVVPKDSVVLSVAVQYGEPVLWALVDEEAASTEVRQFHVIGTGNPIFRQVGRFIGTFQLMGGNFIGHLFEAMA